VPEARELIEGAAYSPGEVEAMGQAFDDAWVIVALRLGGQTDVHIDLLRMSLAHSVLASLQRCGADADALTKAALASVLPSIG